MKRPIIPLHDMGQWQSTLISVLAVLLANEMIEVEGNGRIADVVRRQAAEIKAGNPLDGTRLWDAS